MSQFEQSPVVKKSDGKEFAVADKETFPGSPAARQKILFALLAFHLLAMVLGWILMAVRPFNLGDDWLYSIGIGFVLGQAGFCAVWSVLADQSLGKRMAIGCLGTLATSISTFILFVINGNYGAETIMFAGIVWFQFGVLQGPLWLIRTLVGWRVAFQDLEANSEFKPVQFGLKQMMIWTTGFAAFMGLVRLLRFLADNLRGGRGLVDDDWIFVFAIALSAAFITLVLTAASLVRHHVFFSVLGGILVCAAITALEYLMSWIAFGSIPGVDFIQIICCLNVFTALALVISFGVLRVAGLKLSIAR